MNKQYLNFGFFLAIISIMLYSCGEEKKIRYFNLNVELNEPIVGLKENDPLPSYFKALVNYIDTNCTNELFVPKVTFKRKDLKQSNTYNLKLPLTWINDFRNSREMLPAEYLKEDYDKLITDLVTPKILVEPKGPISITNIMNENSKHIIILNISESSLDSLAILKEKISKRLCEGKGNEVINIMVVNILRKINITEPVETIINNTPVENPKKEEKMKKQVGPKQPVSADNGAKSSAKITPTTPVPKDIVKKDGPKQQNPDNPGNIIPKERIHGKTIVLPNGDIYIGEVKNNLPDGFGTLTFIKARQISQNDQKKTIANANDYLTGNWIKGEPQSGKLYGSDGKIKTTLIFGGE